MHKDFRTQSVNYTEVLTAYRRVLNSRANTPKAPITPPQTEIVMGNRNPSGATRIYDTETAVMNIAGIAATQ